MSAELARAFGAAAPAPPPSIILKSRKASPRVLSVVGRTIWVSRLSIVGDPRYLCVRMGAIPMSSVDYL
jgi:hypothetical protein